MSMAETAVTQPGSQSGTENGAAQANKGPAFFSCWDIHSYYGESYIVQGVSF